MSVIIETAQEQHLSAILALFTLSVNELTKQDYTSEQRKAWTSSAKNQERWLQKIKDSHFLMACDNKELVGFASLENDQHFDFLYRHPNHPNKGIATLLANAIEKCAVQKRMRQISVDSSETALPFFTKRGYQMIRTQEISRHGITLKNYHLLKVL